MILVRHILVSALLVFGLQAQGQVAKPTLGSAKLEGVPLADSLEIGAPFPSKSLKAIGAGLRNKKVMMMNFKVYVAQLFVGEPGLFQKSTEGALKSLPAALPVAIQLHFLRDVDAGKIQSSFREALEANKTDLKKPEIADLLKAVHNGGSAKEGSVLTLIGGKKADGSEILVYEDSNLRATTLSGPAGFTQEVFAIWLGHPSDEGVAKVQEQILR